MSKGTPLTDSQVVDAIAATLGSQYEWDDAPGDLDYISNLISRTGRPSPGNTTSYDHYMQAARSLGIRSPEEEQS